MLTLAVILIGWIFVAQSAYPTIYVPAAMLYSLLGAFVSAWMIRRLKNEEVGLFGCVASTSLFDYSLYGFFACLALAGMVWPWVIWGLGAAISQFLVSGVRFRDSWLPFQRQWARPGLAWLSLGFLTAPLLLIAMPGAISLATSDPLRALMIPLGVLAWTAWAPVLIWRLLVS